MKKGYLIFHHNLMFSSIPSNHYQYIIENIYTEILNLCEEGYPLCLEFNGYTLNKISEISNSYIEKLKKLIVEKKCLIVGSSYTQAAFPLIPSVVNEENIKIGLNIYKKILNIIPKTCLLNEQIYSKSIVDLFKEKGYENFIFDYPNAIKGKKQKTNDKWKPAKNRGMNVIWSDSVLTQKFQKAVWEDIDFEDYFNYFKTKCNSKIIPIYCGDAEVFEYIPGSLNFHKSGNDFKNIRKILKNLQNNNVEITLPEKLIKQNRLNEVEIATPEFPVKTKKQDKYNITRWAVTGRDSMKMNSQCYTLYNLIKNNPKKEIMKELCYLFASDFRTNTTDEKYLDFRNKIGELLSKVSKNEKNKNIEKVKQNYKVFEKGRYFNIETDFLNLSLVKNKGIAINSLKFKKDHLTPVIGTIFQGYLDDISYAADFYSMHSIVVTKEGKQITDLSCKVDDIDVFEDERGIVITNKFPINLQNFSIIKEYILNNTLKVNIKIYFYDLYPLSIRTGILTFLPEFLNNLTFSYSTYNGGKTIETFKVENEEINHSNPVNQMVSASTCLGDTESYLKISSGNENLIIKTDKSSCYTIPLLKHKLIDNLHFLRIYNSMCEKDDVSHQFFKGYKEFKMEISSV